MEGPGWSEICGALNMHKLPGRISSVVAATILLIVVMAAFVIVWMTRALDRQALEQSKVQVEIVRENMLATVDLITIDYSKWGWAYAAVQDQDLEWLFGNIGSAALIGEAVQLAVIWGGPFEADLGWNDDGTVEPRPGLVPAETLEAAESLLADTVPGNFEAVEFFQWQGEDLFVMGASHFEPTGDPTRVPEVGRQTGLLLMGTKIDGEAIAAVARSLSLSGTAVTHDLPADQPSIALPGKDGEPVAYFVWDQPRPGTAMLRQMAPFLLLLMIGAVVLSAANIRFAQRGARTLVLSEQRASRSARTDGLTELPNRAAFNEAIAEAARADERAILFLDINDFSRINDTIGHAVGDQVIVAVARQLSLLVKPNHLLARIGGDEFVFLVTGPDAAAEVRDLAVKARGVFARPLIASKHQLQLRCAIGYAVQTSDDLEGEDLVKQADLAMYEAKRQKSSEPVAFSSVLDNASRNAAIIEQGLRQALLQPDQISVVYQPIVDSMGTWCAPKLWRAGPLPH
jgi:diguanylate cyclase (GGDEF)-like protein